MSKIQPAQRVLQYAVPPGTNYIDLAKDLSAVNRRFYRQGMQYGVHKIEFAFVGDGTATSVALTARTAGSTWVVHNAWKKAQAHWLKQQRDVRAAIGQSAKPKYEDFKVYLDDAHRTGTILPVLASDGAAVGTGDWDYSKLVYVDTGGTDREPVMHLIGPDVSNTDVGLIMNYQESRATVQTTDPELPAEYSTNIYAILNADENLASSTVANNMEDENDTPPYDYDDYPGSDSNSDSPWIQELAVAGVGSPNAELAGMGVECGLLQLVSQGYNATGGEVTAPTLSVQVHLLPGSYKGVAALPMGQ